MDKGFRSKMVIKFSGTYAKRNRGLFILVMMFLSINTLIYAEDFTPALWLDNLQDSESWGWIRLNDGHWWVVMPNYKGYLINDMKVSFQQKGQVLYGYNSENEQYDIPEARINEETASYIVIYWYSTRKQEKLEKIQDPINIYVLNYDKGIDRYLGTLNAVGDE